MRPCLASGARVLSSLAPRPPPPPPRRPSALNVEPSRSDSLDSSPASPCSVGPDAQHRAWCPGSGGPAPQTDTAALLLGRSRGPQSLADSMYILYCIRCIACFPYFLGATTHPPPRPLWRLFRGASYPVPHEFGPPGVMHPPRNFYNFSAPGATARS